MSMFEKMWFGKKEKRDVSSEVATLNRELVSIENQIRMWRKMSGFENNIAEAKLKSGQLSAQISRLEREGR